MGIRTSSEGSRIAWLPFRNNSGRTIPPFSCVVAQSWSVPDPGGDLAETSGCGPIVVAEQLGDWSTNPAAYYLNDAVAVSPGGFGRCARPEIVPMLAAFNGETGALEIGDPLGPVPSDWTLRRGAPGFVLLAIAASGLALVTVSSRGPWVGTLAADMATAATGDVQIWSGPTGAEGNSGVTVKNVYNRFAPLTSGAWCLFDWTGKGYELIAADPCETGGEE